MTLALVLVYMGVEVSGGLLTLQSSPVEDAEGRGSVIVATFALDGPERCSGLPVVRYSPQSLAAEMGPHLAIVRRISRATAGVT